MSVYLWVHTRTYLIRYMKKILSVIFLFLTLTLSAWADNIYYEASFEKGMPKDITLLDRDENPTKSSITRIDFSKGSWTVGQYDKDCSAAMSSSLCTYDYPVDDWMILPKISVNSSLAVLAWDAMSVHYDFREDYKVMISTASNKPADFTEVYAVQDEDYFIRRHAISLADYDGQDIYIAFVHTGQDGFMLGIDNVKVGEFYNEYALDNRTDVSATGGSTIEICGDIRNMASADSFVPVVKVGDELYVADNDVQCATGDHIAFSFTVPTIEEGKMPYTVGVKKSVASDDNIVWSVVDTVYCSAFPRNMLVEKFTGTWCNNCPEGTITMHKYEQRFRNRIIKVEGHCPSGAYEAMADAVYYNGLLYFMKNLPGMVYNRSVGLVSQQAQDDGVIYAAWGKPVTAEIIPSVKYTTDGTFEVSSTVRFSEEYDNSSDRYRVGYIITENVVHQPDNSKYAQSNSCQNARCREYNFLPSTVPASLCYFHDVARGDATAFEGVAGSFPQETLAAYTDYELTDTVAMPATPIFDAQYVYDPRNISITAVLIYTRDKRVLAAARVNTEDIDWSSALADNLQDSPRYNITATDGKVYVSNFEGRATVRLYALDGSLLDTAYDANVVVTDAANYRGVAIVSVETATGVVNEKILIK